MRHNKIGRKLGRNSSHRKAMYRNMVTSLFEHGRIKTTDAKAKELRRIAEKLITLGKRGDLHARRRALSYVRSREVVEKLFDEISSQFATRPGGYTRIVKLGNRRGDNAPISLIELVADEYSPKPKKEKKPAKTVEAAPAEPEVTETEEAVEEQEAAEVEAVAEEASEETPVEEPAQEETAEEATEEVAEEAAEEEDKGEDA